MITSSLLWVHFLPGCKKIFLPKMLLLLASTLELFVQDTQARCVRPCCGARGSSEGRDDWAAPRLPQWPGLRGHC